MKFSVISFHETSNNFQKALRARDIQLPIDVVRDIWAHIIFGQEYLSAIQYIDIEHDAALAIKISADTIRQHLIKYDANVTEVVAEDIFTESINDYLADLMPSFSTLVNFIRKNRSYCLTPAYRDSLGLGILDSVKPGYIPLSEVIGFRATEKEMSWLKTSCELMAAVGNNLATINPQEYTNIFAKNFRKSSTLQNSVFRDFLEQNITSLSTLIVTEIEEELAPMSPPQDMKLSFEEMRDILFDVVELATRREKKEWLNADNDFCEAVLDHLAARLCAALKWEIEERGKTTEIYQTLERTIHLSIEKFLSFNVEP